MVNSEKFAKRLEKIMDHHGISATEFSDTIGVNRSTISHLLSGRNKPSLDFVMSVVEQYPDVELYWLLNGKGSFPPIKKAEQEIQVPRKSEAPGPKPDLSPDASESEIDRIVIFYKDGSFKSYKP